MMLHKLKIKRHFIDDIIANKKTFEIRKDDRNFAVGDLISFTSPKSWELWPLLLYEITYKLSFEDFPDGLKENYCILGIRKIEEFIK